MGINEDVIYIPGARMKRLKELAAKQSGAINAREERLFAANTRTYYPLIIPRREITTLSRKRARNKEK